MFQLDDNLLRELGLGELPVSEKNKMLAHIYETLELRVGMRLAEQMSEQQLDEFEKFIDANDEPGALKWLETNFPDYKKVVTDELNKLKGEIKAQAPQIMQATMQAASQNPPQNNPQPAPPSQPSSPQPPMPPQPEQPSQSQPQWAQPPEVPQPTPPQSTPPPDIPQEMPPSSPPTPVPPQTWPQPPQTPPTQQIGRAHV